MTESTLTTEEQVSSIWQLGGLSLRQLAKQVRGEIDHDNVINLGYELAYNCGMTTMISAPRVGKDVHAA